MAAPSREQIIKVSDDELIRRIVRDHLGGEKKSFLADLLRHPLTSIVIGFILTGVLGTYLTQQIASDREDTIRRAEAKRVKVEAALSSTQEFSRLIYERQGRATLLLAALHRSANHDELRERKIAYDKSFIDWERNIKANLLTIRTASGWPGYSPFEEVIEGHLIRTYISLDSALTSAYDASMRRRPNTNLRRAETLLLVARSCGSKITDSLYSIIPIFEDDDEVIGGIPATLRDEMISECREDAITEQPPFLGAP
jgi:hypothetical protein